MAAKKPDEVSIVVTGTILAHMSFRASDQEFQSKADAVGVSLEREPTNQWDPNALKVMLGEQHVGYLRREDATWVSFLLATGMKLEAVAVSGPTPPGLPDGRWRIGLVATRVGPPLWRVAAKDPWQEKPTARNPAEYEPEVEDIDLDL